MDSIGYEVQIKNKSLSDSNDSVFYFIDIILFIVYHLCMSESVDQINPDHADVTFHVYVDSSVTYKDDETFGINNRKRRTYKHGVGWAIFRDHEPWQLGSKEVSDRIISAPTAKHHNDIRGRRSYSMQGEFIAATLALKELPPGVRVQVFTDHHHVAKVITDYPGWLGADNDIIDNPLYYYHVELLREVVDAHYHVQAENIKPDFPMTPFMFRERHNLAHNLAGAASGSNKVKRLQTSSAGAYRDPLNVSENLRALEAGVDEAMQAAFDNPGDDGVSNEDALENPPLSPFGIIKKDPEP